MRPSAYVEVAVNITINIATVICGAARSRQDIFVKVFITASQDSAWLMNDELWEMALEYFGRPDRHAL